MSSLMPPNTESRTGIMDALIDQVPIYKDAKVNYS